MERANRQNLDEISENLDTSEMDGRFLTFWTDGQLFGIPIEDVVQIVGIQKITEVPEFPFYAKGIINLRGSIIPLIDVRLRLGKQEAAHNERTCIIVTNINERFVGFIVDEVDAVIVIDDSLIAEAPKLTGSTDSYITGIGKFDGKVVLLMNIHKIVADEQLEQLTSATA
ncbi:MAG: chemotaxis protein CheW [Oscillospiraceae bacterium]